MSRQPRRLRLAIAPGSNPWLVVTRQITSDEKALQCIRQHGRPVVDEAGAVREPVTRLSWATTG